MRACPATCNPAIAKSVENLIPKARFHWYLNNAEKMRKAIWLKPEAVAQIEFLEWTEAGRLRHSKFVGLREDKNSRSVIKEEVG